MMNYIEKLHSQTPAFCSPVHIPSRISSQFLRSRSISHQNHLFRVSRPRTNIIIAKVSPDAPKDTSKAVEQQKPAINNSNSVDSSPQSLNGNDEPIQESKNLKRDIIATVAWVAVAAAAAVGIGYVDGTQRGIEFVTAYVVEYSLSVDNLFVFLLIFNYFRVDRHSQARVLSWGIIGAILCRGFMIVAGSELTRRSHLVTLGFAGLLIYSAGNLLFNNDDEEEDFSNNKIVRFWRGLFPFAEQYDGDKFFTKAADGARLATPLLLVLLCIEASDVVFALDSVPAVIGISDDAAVIYGSNILAISGLRNLFFVLSDAIGDLRFLQQALAVVLGFVGTKMAAGIAGYEIGTVQSLSVVVGTLAAGVGFSLAFPENQDVADNNGR